MPPSDPVWLLDWRRCRQAPSSPDTQQLSLEWAREPAEPLPNKFSWVRGNSDDIENV